MINYVILVCLTKTKVFSTSKSPIFIYFALVQRPPGVAQSRTQSCFELRIVFEDLKQFLREIILRCSSKIPLGLSDCLYV